MNIVAAADLHISTRLPYSHPAPGEWWGTNRLGWLCDNLAYLVDYTSENAEVLIVCGDIFHGVPSVYAWRVFFWFVERLEASPISRVIFLIGNHDLYYNSHVLEKIVLPRKIEVIDSSWYRIEPSRPLVKGSDKVTILYLPWGVTEAEINEHAGSKPDYIFGHFSVFGADVNGKKMEAGIPPKVLTDICNQVWLGHYHQPQDVGGVHYIGAAARTQISQHSPLVFALLGESKPVFVEYPQQDGVMDITITEEGPIYIESYPFGGGEEVVGIGEVVVFYGSPECFSKFVRVTYFPERRKEATRLYRLLQEQGAVGIGFDSIGDFEVDTEEGIRQASGGLNIKEAIRTLTEPHSKLALKIYAQALKEVK